MPRSRRGQVTSDRRDLNRRWESKVFIGRCSSSSVVWETRGAARHLSYAGNASGRNDCCRRLAYGIRSRRLAHYSKGRRQGDLHDGFTSSRMGRGRGSSGRGQWDETHMPSSAFGRQRRPIVPLAMHTNLPLACICCANWACRRRIGLS